MSRRGLPAGWTSETSGTCGFARYLPALQIRIFLLLSLLYSQLEYFRITPLPESKFTPSLEPSPMSCVAIARVVSVNFLVCLPQRKETCPFAGAVTPKVWAHAGHLNGLAIG